ncbi:MAG: TIGR01777 family protein [Candidatus Eremiobacteraeota bacterium]|nr:TIGR01777 family protein [Candidatus Eremiobacteraeota bacterium]
MNVTIVGASGFIGKPLCAALRARGDVVTTASLRDPAAAASASNGADVVVNLAGEPVAQRWTPETKAKIRASRADAGQAFVAALGRLERKPAAYVSSSAVGYYGASETATFDETSPPGTDFLAEVCVGWEAAADGAAAFGMRVAKIRTGLVLGADGGALAKLLPLFKLGLGGIVASGRQWYPWIHIADEIGIYLHAIDGTSGALNATAPNPVRNAEFTHALGKALHRPTLFPAPAFAVGLVLGEGASVVTQGQRVVPTRTLATGYTFRYETIDDALVALDLG